LRRGRKASNDHADVHEALRLRAAAADRSIPYLANDAVRIALTEDATELESCKERQDEKSISFDTFVTGLKRRGRIQASPCSIATQP
jgi:hypothetical protein